MGSRVKGLLLMGGKIPNKKSNPPARVEDKISKLPNEVLCHILSFLPTKYAVRTSILSTRWKNVWAFVPNLDFKYVEAKSYFFNRKKDKSTSAGFLTFVDRVISLRGSSDIKKFCLHCSYGIKDFARIDGWIRTAIQHNVVELDLCFETTDKDLAFELPQFIFMCKTLVVLKLRSNCITNAPPASGCFLLSLKILHVRVEYPVNDSMEKIFSCCPVLEDLTIDGLLGSDDVLNFKISAPELKTLRLILPHRNWVGDHDHQYCFLINCPKLENIDLKQDILSKYLFKNAKSLVKASLNLFSHAVADQQPDFSNRANALLAGISNVKYLSLSAHVWERNEENLSRGIDTSLVDYGSTCTERTLCYHVGGCCHVGAAALQVNNNFAAPLQRNIEALAEDGSTWETKAMQTWLAF
ncbi:F-box/LRR-repeat protein At4g14103-like [Prunus avium]|uniref:F-box/LRR-repeat protein At4g14103-like n=1 Tax=Prunus avium TaxID=42229 RepID=A0A6P5SMA7_PRUAV|nr:F-box/LRR-repeat protein At4g14103-like [Prunus avium]XP_021814904.1 F-box/LRR-repeat protein At4g14103-like [Prunus avium]